MVQVPTTSGVPSAHAMRASSAQPPRASTPSMGKNQCNGRISTPDLKQEKPPREPILSMMRSAPLDLTSVERRGQPTATPDHPKKIRPHGLAEAPSYYPTVKEWRDPYAYIKKIQPEAEKYGICKITPPKGWDPELAINTERFHFKTRKQELNSIEGSTRANLTYLDQLQKFHQQNGNNLNKFPSVDKRPLDLFKLKKFVELRGGFAKVCQMKKWAEIGRDLGYSGKIMSSLSTSLKNSYQRWLEPYEEYLRHAKPGVQAQLELEYGGPLTPSPAQSPFKRPSDSHTHTPSSLRNDSPAIRASDALNASMHSASDMREVPMLDPPNYSSQSTPAPQAPPRSGFTPVNAGGFTPVNSTPVGFTPVNRREREREPERSFTPPWRDGPMASVKGTPDYRPSGLSGTPLTKLVNGVTSDPSPKRQPRQESHESSRSKRSPSENDESIAGRRSKRLKKDAIPTVAGSHMSFLRPFSRTPGEPGYFAPGEKCEQCGKGDEEGGQLLLCESCDHGYHMECLEPPLARKPEYEWNCPRCLVGDGQFGFEEGSIYSLKQFQEKASAFKENYFKDRMPYDPVLNCHRPVTEDDIEREFWRLVADLEDTVEVEYGADIHSTTHGSGFPTPEVKPGDPYSRDPWNLNIMPLHPDSLFRNIKTDISGMTVPWLYVGMIFSTFCWHNEDHYAYSANYQHFGATKTWYGIPGKDADKFENAMREAVPELFETQPDLLFQLVTLLTPEQLKKAGVEVYALDQRAGQFVITFPQAYHAGFNHGFNLNEAVNFAPKDWEPYGQDGVMRLQQFRRQPCFSHDELLWTAAEGQATGGVVTVETAKWLKPAFVRMRDRELALRAAFHNKHYTQQPHPCTLDQPGTKDSRCYLKVEIDETDVPEEEYSCVYCKSYAYLSRFKCETSGKVLCLAHAGTYECCDLTEEERFFGGTVRKGQHTLYIRRTEEAMDKMYEKISDKADLPEAWNAKLMLALEDDVPSLKTMRALVHEGDRIPYYLPSYPDLKDWVEECNKWVEEATSYLVRKQNRRKSGKLSKKANEAEAAEEKRLRNPNNIEELIKKAEGLNFSAPEIDQLRERSEAIKKFERDASVALAKQLQTTDEIEELLERGSSLQVDLPQIHTLHAVMDRAKWNDEAEGNVGKSLTLAEVNSLIEKAEELHIYPNTHHLLRHYIAQKNVGELWETKAKELLSADVIHYPQLTALSEQAKQVTIPTTSETLAKVEQILAKQREAQAKIRKLLDRTKEEDFSKRPRYLEVKETVDALSELNSKPNGTLDLEKEQKRHEDWMRKGKKLFGKANAPLHILKTHMEYVLERNLDCFDTINDNPRLPAEPASREPSPIEDGDGHSWEDPRNREVFCICRRIEAGMMIECEHCHEWYHGKCLKIARGKVKEDEKYTCPICDWRVKIPRDAARPKLEDLIEWQSEISSLPFQPEEEEVLQSIIDNAQDFRNHVSCWLNELGQTGEETAVLRFYLRKIEGAEILLVRETNFFRRQLHKWDPVADEPPPVLESSKSTRKPRPTKLQKLMAVHGVKDPEDLPVEVRGLRTKMHRFGGQDSIGKGTQSLQNNQHQSQQQQQQQQHMNRQLPMMPMSMGGMSGTMNSYAPHQQPGVHLNGYPAPRYTDHNHALNYNGGGPHSHQLHQTLAQLGQNSHNSSPYACYDAAPRAYERPLFENSPSLREPEREPERERDERAGIDRMFSDLTNTEDAAEDREEAVRRAEGGAKEQDKDVEMGGVAEGPTSQGAAGGQAEELLSTMALYDNGEGGGNDSPRWEN